MRFFIGPGSTLYLALALSVGTMLWSPAQQEQEKAAAAVAAVIDAGKETVGSKKLWGALVYASKDAADKREGFEDADAEMTATLKKVFTKFSHFQVLGVRAESLYKSTHSWVAPSKQLCVKFDYKGLTENELGVKLDLQLWSQGKALVKTDAIFMPNSPVFMEGPEWGNGRLLYVLRLQDDASEKPAAK
ncbi:MAG: hypothetical protein ACI8T1_004377 [Verrucomicrobiales bacterium]|jgi:hypothetical protein